MTGPTTNGRATARLTKQHPHDLALFGGQPAFDQPLHVGAPNVENRAGFLQRVNAALDRRWLTNNGPLARELEARLADWLGVRHCVLVSNGTAGLELAARALDLAGEVLVPALTFVATAHALAWCGLTPVFCEVDPHTHNLDPDDAARRITSRTSAIVGVHLWGRACPVNALDDLAQRHGLRLLFDAAHALGGSHGGRRVGGFGAAEVFSFHATKFFNTLEGGAVTTNDDEVARRLRLLRNFGFTGYDAVESLGANAKLNEVAAAMGLAQLEQIDSLIAVNHRNYRLYQEALAGVPGVRLLDYPAGEHSNYQYVVVEVDEAAAGLSRDALLEMLWGENVLARRYFYPGCHRMEPYRSQPRYAGLRLPCTEAVLERTVCLPTGTATPPEAVSAVGGLIRLAVEHAAEVRAAYAARGFVFYGRTAVLESNRY